MEARAPGGSHISPLTDSGNHLLSKTLSLANVEDTRDSSLRDYRRKDLPWVRSLYCRGGEGKEGEGKEKRGGIGGWSFQVELQGGLSEIYESLVSSKNSFWPPTGRRPFSGSPQSWAAGLGFPCHGLKLRVWRRAQSHTEPKSHLII